MKTTTQTKASKMAPVPVAAKNKKSLSSPSAKSTPAKTTPNSFSSAKSSPTTQNINSEMIATRAYYIHLSGQGGTSEENWARAEQELLNSSF